MEFYKDLDDIEGLEILISVIDYAFSSKDHNISFCGFDIRKITEENLEAIDRVWGVGGVADVLIHEIEACRPDHWLDLYDKPMGLEVSAPLYHL